MINHARTLLMNVNGSAPLLNYYAEEIIDPAFNALTLPTELKSIRSVLFGATPDRNMLNYRCRQLLALTQGTPLEQYLLAYDRRVTYNFRDISLVGSTPWTPKATTISGDDSISLFGTPYPPDDTGRMYHRFLVSVNSPGVVTIERTTDPIQKVDIGFSVGDLISLPLVHMSFSLSSTESGQAYVVDIYSRPTSDLSALAKHLSGIGEPTLLFLFGLANKEPDNTLRNLWFKNHELSLKLGALVCALVQRSEDVRNAT